MWRSYRFGVVTVAVTLLIASSCAGVLAAGKAPQNAVLVGWDGVGRDDLKQAISLGLVPNLMSLTAKGRIVAIDVTRMPDRASGWAQVLTGYEAEVTGCYDNEEYGAIPAGLTVFERLEALLGSDNIYTAFLSSMGRKVGGNPPSGDTPAGPYYLSQDNIDLFEQSLGLADAIGARALEVLDANGSERFFLFVAFKDVGRAINQNGRGSPEVAAAFQLSDAWLGQIVQKLEDLGVRKHTSIYVTSPYSFDERELKQPDRPYVFLASDDRRVSRRGWREDITPTILWRMDVDFSAVSPELRGHALQEHYSAPIW